MSCLVVVGDSQNTLEVTRLVTGGLKIWHSVRFIPFIPNEKCGPKCSNFAKRGASETITESLIGGYIVCSAHKMNKANSYYHLQEKEKASDIPEVPN